MLFPILFATYLNKIWCDVVTMDVGHIILGRLWLYDLNITIYQRSNFYSFVYKRKESQTSPNVTYPFA